MAGKRRFIVSGSGRRSRYHSYSAASTPTPRSPVKSLTNLPNVPGDFALRSGLPSSFEGKVMSASQMPASSAMTLTLGAGRATGGPDALEAFTGTREISGKAIVAYFAPLQAWLKQQNTGEQCGW